MENGQLTCQKFKWTSFQFPHDRWREPAFRGRESPKIRDNKRRQAHSDRCRKRIEENLRRTPHGAERLNRREEVINEALAEEVQRRERREKETDRVATAATGIAKVSAPAKWKENPIEPDPDPKRRMIMKSTSLTASSSSGHNREKRTKSDMESKMQVENTSVPVINESSESTETVTTNTRRRIVGKSEPVAVTTLEAIDGYREKTRIISSLEQFELGNIMELSISCQLLGGARQMSFHGGISLCKKDGWDMKNHSHLRVARRMRKKTHPTALIVTVRENEERGMCSVTLRELWRIIKDQMKERMPVVVVTTKNSAIWRRASMGLETQKNQLEYVNVERMRIITNSKHVAEQIKIDKGRHIVMDGVKFENDGKIDEKKNLKNTVMDGDKIEKDSMMKSTVMDGEKIGRMGYDKNDGKLQCRSEEELRKSILKGLVKRNQEKHAVLAQVEETQEEEREVVCYDDFTGKELPWCAVRKARELELQYLRNLGVYEKVDEKEAIKKYGVTPIDTKWIDTDKAFEGEPLQN